MNYYPRFAELLNEALARLDRPPAWLAKRLDVSQSTVGRWLNQGTRPSDAEMVLRIADILGMASRAQEFLIAAGYGVHIVTEPAGTSRAMPPPTPARLTEQLQRGIRGIPEVSSFFGREQEQARLQAWITPEDGTEKARLIAVLGQGGLGKSTLVAQAVRTHLAGKFDRVLWCSLLNAPLLHELVDEILNAFKGEGGGGVTASTGQLLAALMDMLRRERCLLLLDNFESVLASSDESNRAGSFRKGYEPYQQLLTVAAQQEHSSCLLYTSRERPQGMARLEVDYPWVHSLVLGSLELDAGRAMLRERGLQVEDGSDAELIDRYSGNPLALNVVAEIVQAYFGGDVAGYLAEETAIFDDIRRLLDDQFARLTDAERDVLLWMAVARTPLSLQTLRAKWLPTPALHVILEAVRGLERRSLVETSAGTFFLQNVITEYVTEHIIDTICAEIQAGQTKLLISHALLDMNAAAYVRRSQRRMLHAPILARLTDHMGEASLRPVLLHLLETLRSSPLPAQGYAPGNLLNLLIEHKGSLADRDLSQLAIRHTDLSDALLSQVDFSNAEFYHTHFMHTFDHPICLAYSPDGTLLAGGSFSSTIYIWRTDTWQPIANLTGHSNWTGNLVFSPDGRTLASAGLDDTIRLWDMVDMTLRATIMNPGGTFSGLSFHPDGDLLASAGGESVRIWRIADGNLEGRLPIGKNDRGVLAWHPDGRHLLVPTRNGDAIAVWDFWERREVKRLSPVGTGKFHSFAISPDGTLVAGAGYEREVHVWSTDTGQEIWRLDGHRSEIIKVAFGYDGQWLVSSSVDRTVRIWDLATGVLRHTLTAHEHYVLGLAAHPRRSEIASSANDHTLAIWEADSGRLLNFFHGYAGLVSAVCFSRDGKTVASGSYSGQLNVWEVETGESRLTLLRAHERGVYSVAYSPDGALIASGNAAGMGAIQLRHSRTGRLIRTLEAPPAPTACIAFSPDGSLVAGAMGERNIHIWQVATGDLKKVMTGHTDDIYGLTFSPDGRWLGSGSADTTVRLWSVETGELVKIFTGHERWCRGVSFHPSGTIIAGGGDDQTIRLWSVPEGKEIAVLQGHEAQVRALTFLPDGERLLSGSYDRTLRLWDTATGEVIKVFRGHTGFVMSVDVSPDGRLGVSGSFDETVRIWDIATGECLRVLRGEHPYEEMNIAGAKGLTSAQIASLKELGAVERY